jgi:hypothetical protein
MVWGRKEEHNNLRGASAPMSRSSPAWYLNRKSDWSETMSDVHEVRN